MSVLDDVLLYQIKSRLQARNKLVIYIACMGTLFSRLSHSPAEVTKKPWSSTIVSETFGII